MIKFRFEKVYKDYYGCEVEAETLEEAIEIAKHKEFHRKYEGDSDILYVTFSIDDFDEENQEYVDNMDIEEGEDLPLDGWD